MFSLFEAYQPSPSSFLCFINDRNKETLIVFYDKPIEEQCAYTLMAAFCMLTFLFNLNFKLQSHLK